MFDAGRTVTAILFLATFWCEAGAGAAGYQIEELITHRMTPMLSTRYQEKDGIVWLDNTRIMFRGFLSVAFPERVDQGVYIWDTEKKQATRYGDETTFCYADGTLFLTEDHRDDPRLKKNTEVRYRYGPFGKENPGSCDRNAIFHGGCLGLLNMSCKPIKHSNKSDPLGASGRIHVQLRDEDGFVGVLRSWRGSALRNPTPEEIKELSRQPLLLFDPRHREGKPLPIQELERIETGTTSYSDYSKKYVFVGAIPKNASPGHLTNWPKDQPQPVYLMDSDGKVEIVNVPKQTDWTSIFEALPTKAGLAYKGVHGRTGGGLFLYTGNQTLTLDRGGVATLAVSPDGCNIAFAIWNDYLRAAQKDLRMKYVNLCRKG